MSEEVKKVEGLEQEPKAEEKKEAEAVMAAVVHKPGDQVVTVKQLLEAGVHLGHPTRKWNPKMKKYILDQRNNVYIIDLLQTQAAILEAYEAIKNLVSEGGKVLFVGTKQQVKSIVEEEAIRSGSFYVNNRWLGGILTNFNTISARIKYLKNLEERENNGSLANLTKKEAALLNKEKSKLSKNLDGIKEMRKTPNALIVVDPSVEYNAVREAKKLNIPVFAIVDTNCDPDNIKYVIPGNDDAAKSVKLVLQLLADAIVEAKGGVTSAAYTPIEGEDITSKDIIKHVEKENAARLAAYREAKRLKQEAYEKAQAEKAARLKEKLEKRDAAAKKAANGEKPEGQKPQGPKPAKAPKAPKAEVKEEKPAEQPAEKPAEKPAEAEQKAE